MPTLFQLSMIFSLSCMDNLCSYPEAAEDDVRRYERSFKKLPPAHKVLSLAWLIFKKLLLPATDLRKFVYSWLWSFTTIPCSRPCSLWWLVVIFRKRRNLNLVFFKIYTQYPDWVFLVIKVTFESKAKQWGNFIELDINKSFSGVLHS